MNDLIHYISVCFYDHAENAGVQESLIKGEKDKGVFAYAGTLFLFMRISSRKHSYVFLKTYVSF